MENAANTKERFGSPYFAYIDGLRAVAIIPVVLYHIFPMLCPGGFTGVDVFFVISGYLITKGIVGELKAARFSFVGFYVRRIKRIIPAYFSIIAFVLLTCFFVYSCYAYLSICKTAIYSAIYATNIYFSNSINYFDLASKRNPLLHLWSLGVEEQFYLLAPAILWIIWAANRKLLLFVLVLLCLISFAFSVFTISCGNMQSAFFMIPSRAWEFLAGSIISQLNAEQITKWRFSIFISSAGLVLVLTSYFVLNDISVFPGAAALPSVIGSGLIILCGNKGYIKNLLCTRYAVYIGKVSYSLYLWHWPIFVLFGSIYSVKRAVAGILATSLMTFLSYQFIEIPVRTNKALGTRQTFGLMICASLLIIVFCSVCIFTLRSSDTIPTQWGGQSTWMVAESSRDISRSHCSINDFTFHKDHLLIKLGKPDQKPSFVLWGDSHALALLPGIDKIADQYGKAGYFINLKHNFTLLPDIGVYPYNPKADREPVLQWLESRPDITDIFLVNAWFFQIKSTQDIDEVIAICKRLVKTGKHVYFFKNAPLSTASLFRFEWEHFRGSRQMSGKISDYEKASALQDALVKELMSSKIATVIPLEQAFYNGSGYSTMENNHSYYIDEHHLNTDGAIRAAKFAAPLIWHPENNEKSRVMPD